MTQGPGLLGSLLVGINTAKTLAWVYEKEIVAVNHLHGHICANYLESFPDKLCSEFSDARLGSPKKRSLLTVNEHFEDERNAAGETLKIGYEPPFLCLLVSGGHTQIIKVSDYINYEILGESVDDACGEAFDKVAKLLGLPYPGGPELDKLAQSATDTFVSDSEAQAKSIMHGKYTFPIAQVGEFDFSFSGLKTAVLRLKQSIPEELWFKDKAKIALAFQQTVSKTLLRKMKNASEVTGFKKIVIAGGVAANSTLRREFEKEFSSENGFELSKPQLQFCTDNAAMIASAGYFKYQSQKGADELDFAPFSR